MFGKIAYPSFPTSYPENVFRGLRKPLSDSSFWQGAPLTFRNWQNLSPLWGGVNPLYFKIQRKSFVKEILREIQRKYKRFPFVFLLTGSGWDRTLLKLDSANQRRKISHTRFQRCRWNQLVDLDNVAYSILYFRNS